MPPNLHPRSRMTSSLFATTLLASFLVVGLPHLIPCPAPRVAYADGELVTGPDGVQRRRRRRRVVEDGDGCPMPGRKDRMQPVQTATEELDGVEVKALGRECPIPKPRGMVGEILGFKQEAEPSRILGNEASRPP